MLNDDDDRVVIAEAIQQFLGLKRLLVELGRGKHTEEKRACSHVEQLLGREDRRRDGWFVELRQIEFVLIAENALSADGSLQVKNNGRRFDLRVFVNEIGKRVQPAAEDAKESIVGIVSVGNAFADLIDASQRFGQEKRGFRFDVDYVLVEYHQGIE